MFHAIVAFRGLAKLAPRTAEAIPAMDRIPCAGAASRTSTERPNVGRFNDMEATTPEELASPSACGRRMMGIVGGAGRRTDDTAGSSTVAPAAVNRSNLTI